MKIELHLIQNFPPSNLNRDDTGSPKDTEFGGYRRARVSSQCLKRSIRRSEEFRAELSGGIGQRTKRSASLLAERLVDRHGRDPGDARVVADAALRALVGISAEEGLTSVLFYVGDDELDDLADRLAPIWDSLAPLAAARREADAQAGAEEGGDEKKKKGKKEKGGDAARAALDTAVAPLKREFINARKGRVGSVDIALFGRMLAEEPTLNIDAACQVAHAISTNKVSMEYDYFTAVDDLNPEGETGAGMIGTVGYNSSCFYRYAMIDADLLARNLGGNRDLAREGIRAFIRGAIAAIPSGKQNTFAAKTPPSFVMAVARGRGMPWSLANAFEKPVRPGETGSLVDASIAALDRHWKALATMYGSSGAEAFVASSTGSVEALAGAVRENVDAVVDGVMGALEAHWIATEVRP
jgi:CRISPR system Cascade subunit CasC